MHMTSVQAVRRKSVSGASTLLLCVALLVIVCAACDQPANSTNKVTKHTVSTDNGGAITYSILPQDVLVRTFYGGGKLGSLEMTPDISIYGDGTVILGPGLHPKKGMLSSEELQQLVRTLVTDDAILSLHMQQYYDVPDQNATLLQVALNGQYHEYLYGPFGNLAENAQDMSDYKRLGNAIATIRNAITGTFSAYTSSDMALLVNQAYSPDLTQTIPEWTDADFMLYNVAVYECGAIPPDETGPNADNGCLRYTVPHNAVLLTAVQQRMIMGLLHGQTQGIFVEQNKYYSVILRPLLPDELAQNKLAMYGSNDLDYVAIPLKAGPVPTPVPTP